MLGNIKYSPYIYYVIRFESMKVKDLKKLLENMNGELPVVFKVDGFNFVEVDEAKISYIRRQVVLK